MGIYRRIANSLFMEWSGHQRRPEHLTTTDFQTLMAEEHRAKALRLVLGKRPSLKNLSSIGVVGKAVEQYFTVLPPALRFHWL